MNARGFADKILEGAAMTPSCRGALFGANGSTCALGAGYYACGYRSWRELEFCPKEVLAARIELSRLYSSRYGSHMILDNDGRGRDHVVQNIKEMINEGLT